MVLVSAMSQIMVRLARNFVRSTRIALEALVIQLECAFVAQDTTSIPHT